MNVLEPRGRIKIDIDDTPLYVVGTSSCITYYKDEDHQIKHRLGGPAVINFTQRLKQWWKNGFLHRDDGPAVIYRKTHKELLLFWYINGEAYTEIEYNRYYILKHHKESSSLVHPELDSLYELNI